MNMYHQLKNLEFCLVIFGDAVIFALADIPAYLFRFEFLFTPVYLQHIQPVLIWFVPLKLVVFCISGYTGADAAIPTSDIFGCKIKQVSK
jgi:hypothetical protein